MLRPRLRQASGFEGLLQCALQALQTGRATRTEDRFQDLDDEGGRANALRARNGAPPYSGDDCLIWPFGKNSNGYAKMTLAQADDRIVSRYLCELVHGAPPAGDYEAAFTCGNGQNACVNPRHIVWRTRQENSRVRVAEGRTARGTRFPHAKLDAAKVRAIRRSYPGTRAKKLAAIFGVCETTIFNVIRRRNWGLGRLIAGPYWGSFCWTPCRLPLRRSRSMHEHNFSIRDSRVYTRRSSQDRC